MGEDAYRRRWPWLLAAITALGLALRIAGAQGGLSLDEAWSSVQARDAGTPLGVFLNINHDNNHHLNSIWLLLVGFDASPLLQRALSIAAGTASVVVAARIGFRRAPSLGLLTAVLFAVSPVLVSMGSEARGYAPMALCLLLALWLIARWLAEPGAPSPAVSLALCFFIGAFFQLTILFGLFAVAGWVFFALWRRDGFTRSAFDTLRLFLPTAIAIGLVFAIIAYGALTHHGFRFGSYDPFGLVWFLHGVTELYQYTFGIPIVSVWWVALIPALVVLAPGLGVSRMGFHRLAILAFPAVLVLFQAGNVGHPRYYLLSALSLLILVAEMLWLEWHAGGWRRWPAAAALVAILAGSLVCDVDLAINRRGDSMATVEALKARAPRGTRILLDQEVGRAILEAAAASAHYPLEITRSDCPPPPFLYIFRFRGDQRPPVLVHCGRRYGPIAARQARGFTGTDWTLYEVQP